MLLYSLIWGGLLLGLAALKGAENNFRHCSALTSHNLFCGKKDLKVPLQSEKTPFCIYFIRVDYVMCSIQPRNFDTTSEPSKIAEE